MEYLNKNLYLFLLRYILQWNLLLRIQIQKAVIWK